MPRGVPKIPGGPHGGGMPPADPARGARALAMVDAGTHSPADAAEEVGLSHMTVRRRLREREAAPLDQPPRPAPPPAPIPPPTPEAFREALKAHGGNVAAACKYLGRASQWAYKTPAIRAILNETRPDPMPAPLPIVTPPESPRAHMLDAADLAFVRRVLVARPLSSVADLDDALAMRSQGEVALAAWLATPIEEDTAAVRDPLDALRINLARLTRELRRPAHGKANASLHNSLTSVSKAIESIMNNRPREPTRDEIEARIAGAADIAREKICEYTKEAHAKLDADRAELSAWGRSVLGPVGGAELDRRVGLMLGEAEA